jgi:hypothetical protein
MSNKAIEVKGLRELERALLGLQKEYGGKSGAQALRPAVVAAIKPLKARVQDNTPVDEGWLLKSVKQSVGKPTRDMMSRTPAFYNGTTVLAGRVGYFGNNVWKRAVHMEYGTVDVPAKHTLEQVFDSESHGMIIRFSKTLGPAIEKKAKALNRKRGAT